MADTPTGETVTPGDSQTPVQTPAATPVANASDPAEVDRLRKEAEQKELRIRQLENEAAARLKADEEARAKKLEEEGQYKELLDKERAEKQRLLDEKEATERNALLSKETDTVLSKYSPAVVEIAKTAGLSLVDDSDEAKTSLTQKLDDIASKVGGSARVQPNNPAPVTPTGDGREQLLDVMGNPDTRPRDREAAAIKYAGTLNAVKQMKEQAGIPADQ